MSIIIILAIFGICFAYKAYRLLPLLTLAYTLSAGLLFLAYLYKWPDSVRMTVTATALGLLLIGAYQLRKANGGRSPNVEGQAEQNIDEHLKCFDLSRANPMIKSLGDRLIIERDRLLISQSSFAQRCGVKRTIQHIYEANIRVPDRAYLAKVQALGCDVNYLVNGVYETYGQDNDAMPLDLKGQPELLSRVHATTSGTPFIYDEHSYAGGMPTPYAARLLLEDFETGLAIPHPLSEPGWKERLESVAAGRPVDSSFWQR